MSLVEQALEVRQRIARRLAELEPLVREYEELVRVAREMGIEADEARRARGHGARRGGAQRSARGGRNQLPEDLVDRVLEAVRADPGKTIADYATILGLPQTALYRPVRELTDRGDITKRARQLFAE